MKKLIIFWLALSFSAAAQKSPIKFGDIPMEDMELTSYPLDESAPAVILADYGEASVRLSSVHVALVFERHVRIKILKKEGLSWADAAIPLYHSGSAEERVIGLKAATYNLEGGEIVETKMAKDGIFKEKFNRNINLQKFTLPNVKEGSVIEYSYNVSSEFLANYPNWQFQYPIPVRHSEYWAIIPEFFQMEKYMQGYLPATSYEVTSRSTSNYKEDLHHWTMKDAPAFKPEPYMTNERDYMSKINFALAYISFPGQPVREVMGTWDKLAKDLMESESFGRAISGSGFLKKKVEEVVASETDPQKKMEKIYNYVRRELEWTGENDFVADHLKDVFEKRKGTAGDINIALASMLEKAGFIVDMVLLSTRDHGFIRTQYPMSRQFNYVICAPVLEGRQVFLDATDRYIPMGVLPERCLNGQGLIVSNSTRGWINLETKTKERTVTAVELNLNESAELSGQMVVSRDGYDAARQRKEFYSQGEEAYVKSSFSDHPGWEVSHSSFDGANEIDKSFKENHELKISDHIMQAGDVMYINPFITEQIEENPFKLEKREFPVDYGCAKEKIYSVKLTIPDGYEIDELPESKMMALPGSAARYLYNATRAGNTINITSAFSVNRNIFTQEEYPNLREFYNLVVAKQAEQIVLKKK